MIDQTKETLLSLNEAARTLPKIDGKRPHLSTLWRWARVGVRGVRLEYLRLGRRVVTSAEALNRFAQDLANADTDYTPPTTPVGPKGRSPKERERALADARAILDRAGI